MNYLNQVKGLLPERKDPTTVLGAVWHIIVTVVLTIVGTAVACGTIMYIASAPPGRPKAK